MPEFVPLAEVASAEIEALLDRAFGPDRHGRTAYRVRAGTAPVPALSIAARSANGETIGVIQCWPVALACDSGELVPLVMVGPVAVEPSLQQAGIGRALMEAMLAAAAATGLERAMMLIGDPEYYERFFGFTSARTGGWRLPGPFDPRRLLARGPAVPDCAGLLVPRIAAAA